MSRRNYWTALRQRRISRRTMLGASAKAGVGAVGLALVGCGDDDGPDAGAVAAERAAAAAEEAAAAAVAAGDARAADSEAAAAVAAAAADAAADAADAAGEASAAASQAASAADAAAALAAEAAESEDAGNAAAAAEAAAAAAAQAADAAGAAGDAAAAAVADAAAQAAEAAAQAARDVAAAVEAGTATAAAAQAAIDNAAEAAAAAAAAAGEASAAAGQAAAAAGAAAATAQETAATAAAVAEAAAETAAAAVAAAEEAADAAREAAESAAMAAAEPEGPAAGETDLNATVRIAIGPNAGGGLDPIRASGPHTLPHYDKLAQFDQFSKEFVASSATFEWVDDFTAGIVEIKPGMKWHDGASVTAEDVKFSLDRYGGIAPYNPDGATTSLYGWMVSAIRDEVTVEGPLTVRIPLHTDASAFSTLGTEVRLTPKHIIEEIGDEAFANLGVGSGPFQLESYEPDDQVVSTRFEDYYVEAGSTHRVHKPWMARLEQYVRPEPLSRVAALEAGEADMTLSLGWELSKTFEDSDDFYVLFAPGTDNWNIAMNTLRPAADGSFPFQDIRVRRAINHAVNWEAIIESRGGFERRGIGISRKSIGAITDEQAAALVYEYNPEKARALLAEAGYADGFHVPFWGYSGRFAGVAEGGLAIAQDLAKVGITTDFQADVHAVFRPRMGAIGDDGIHEAPGFHFYFFGQGPDPFSNINAWIDGNGSLSHSKADPGSNIPALVEATRTAFDPAERAKAINALQVAIYDEAMFLFGIEQANVGVMRKNFDWTNFGTRQDEFGYWGIRPMVT